MLRRSKEQIEDNIIRQLTYGYVVVGDCWIWKGQLFGNGYGRIKGHRGDVRFSYRAHVASYQHYVGPVLNKLYVCHSCDQKNCIRPKHLWLGTNKENQLDAAAKGVLSAAWTSEMRAKVSARVKGEGNPMYGMRGELAPCYGRTGDKHPMYGKHHTDEAKAKISQSIKRTLAK